MHFNRLQSKRWSTGGICAAIVLGTATAWADVARSVEAQDLSRYKEESVPGGTLLVVAYMIMWGLVGFLAVRTALRQTRTERDVAALQDRIERLDDPSSPPQA